jgi:hypothetical protein
MRVISQDGTIDVPYEMVVIQRFRNAIYFLNRNLTGVEGLINDIALAEYSTKEKAIKAMEMLKEHYGLLSFMKLIAGTTKYESFIKRFTEDDFIKATTEYFQFPQDDEIEV